MAVLIALPSVGSRVEDATLSADMRARLVLASVQHSDPRQRNRVLTDPPAMAPVRIASLGQDQAAALRSMAAVLPEPRAQVDILQTDALRAAPIQRASLPMPDFQGFIGLGDQGLPTVDSVAAPVALGSHLAPHSSTRPKARPAGMQRRVVQYSRSWLRAVPLRELNEQEACLATAIYHEARGEGIRGQFAVAEVVLNRVASRQFPGTICGVVYQGVRPGRLGGCQFSFACDGRSEAMPNRTAAAVARRIAQVMADGGHSTLTQGALYFHTTAVNPSWAQRFTRTSQIGAHLFYRG